MKSDQLPTLKVLHRGYWILGRKDGTKTELYSDGTLQISMDEYVFAWAKFPSNETVTEVSQGQ